MENRIIRIENGIVSIPPLTEIWMTQHEISSLFECYVSKVNVNIRSLFKSGVLNEADVCRIHHYQNGNLVEQYNLEMIIALAFRIQSRNAEIFRKWLIKKAPKTEIPEMLILPIQNPIWN